MADGETLLALQTTDEPAVYGEIGLDNTGARATGSERLSADLNFNSPGRRGELINMSLLHSRGSDYGRFRLAVPEGHQGLRLGVSASYMDYKVVDGPSANSAAPITGRSSSFGLDWSYPLVRARLQNVYGTGALENKKFFTRDTQVRSDYATDSLRLGLSGNRFDNFGGGGANSASVQLLWGNLTDMQAHTQIDTLARSYRKAAYGVSRQQNLMPQHSLYVSFSGQDAPQVLDSSERFYIGGASSVRAYPSSEHGGDRGQVLNAEWRWRVSPNFLLTAFVDAGRVVQLAQPSMPETTLRLRGRGLSLAWQGPKGLTTQLTWAHRNGQNPLPTLTGTDGDGTLLSTWHCLHERHPDKSRAEIEAVLKDALNQHRVLWLEHGYLEGDDTDAHIDTLARFASPARIVYQGCQDPADSHYGELQAMAAELRALRRTDGMPYELFELPWPQPVLDGGRRLAASYANFLIVNGAVLMPVYGDAADAEALAVMARAFPGREIVGIPCRDLIWQNGSLHCCTMQLPEGLSTSAPEPGKRP